MKLEDFLYDQQKFSLETFGPGERLGGILQHIRIELLEVMEKPEDIYEWVDVIILAFDGALRQGHLPEEIAAALQSKLAINMNRTWPDWRESSQDEAITHTKI
jgi:hypothetical protein